MEFNKESIGKHIVNMYTKEYYGTLLSYKPLTIECHLYKIRTSNKCEMVVFKDGIYAYDTEDEAKLVVVLES